jgi:hypothetical protein
MGEVYKAARYPAAANHRAENFAGRGRSKYVSPTCFAIYEAALGRSERAVDYLETSLADRDPYVTRMAAEPYFDFLRENARYRELLGRMKLG